MNRTKKIASAFFALALTTAANSFSVFAQQQPVIIGRTYKESKPSWEPLPQAPKGAPNVIYLVLDDVGYAQLGSYGSQILTPNLVLQRELSHLGFLLFRFSTLRVRLR